MLLAFATKKRFASNTDSSQLLDLIVEGRTRTARLKTSLSVALEVSDWIMQIRSERILLGNVLRARSFTVKATVSADC